MNFQNALATLGIRIKKITDSYWYIAAINIFVLLCWLFNLFFVGIAAFFLGLLLVLLTQKNLNGMLPFMASVLFVISGTGNGVDDIAAPQFLDTFLIVLYCLIPFLVAAFVWFFVRNKTKIRSGRLLQGLIVFFFAALFAGAGTKLYTLENVLTVLLYGVLIIAAYLLFSSVLDFKEEGFKKIFCLSFLGASLVMAAQTVISYFQLGYVFVGWGIGNTVGQMMALYIPFAFYLIAVSKSKIETLLLYAAVFVIAAATFLTKSRTAILAAGLELIPLYIITYKKADKTLKKTNLLALAAAAGVLLVFGIIFSDKIIGFIGNLSNSADLTSGRDILWLDGLKAFLDSPIFGKSFFYTGSVGLAEVQDGFIFMYWYHNTFVQILTNMGIVGFAALVYFMVTKYKTYLYKGDLLSFFIFMVLITGEFEGLLDIHTVTIAYNVFMVMFIAGGEQLTDGKQYLFKKSTTVEAAV